MVRLRTLLFGSAVCLRGCPEVPWRSRWTEGVLRLWLVATAVGMALVFVVALFFYWSYEGVRSA